MTASSRKLAVHVALFLALLLAQLAAQDHAYSHAAGAQSQLCTDCLAGAPLLATASTADLSFVFFGPQQTHIDGVRVVSLISRHPHFAFRSRAPPHLV